MVRMDIPQIILKPKKKAAFPKRLLFIDTETLKKSINNEEHHYFKLGWTCYLRFRSDLKTPTKEWKFHTNAYACCKTIESYCQEKTSLYIFAHNAFFDLNVSQFYKIFSKLGWEFKFRYEKGTTYLLSISKGKKNIKIISTTNFFDTSVRGLGEIVGLPKLDVDFEASSDEELKVYCKRDVEIIMESILYYFTFIKEHALGGFCLTKASQAMTAFRYRFMNVPLYVHSFEKAIDLERTAYYGGRTEAFQFGVIDKGPFTTLDINSQYPFVMLNKPMPTQLIEYLENPRLTRVNQALRQCLVCADVLLETSEPAYAVRRGNKILFPIGKFRTSVCTEGLKYAIEHNHLKKVFRLSCYRFDYIFEDYVKYFYDLKLRFKRDKNEVLTFMVKIFLNSLYGKFGQKITEDIIEECTEEDKYSREEILDLRTGKTHIEYYMFNAKVSEGEEKEGGANIVAICAHVTEYARFLLYRIIKAIGFDKVLYCDTDSIKLRSSDLSFVNYDIDSEKLGALKNEGETKELAIYGAKHYITEKNRKIKGVPHSAKEISPFTYEYMSFLKQREHMRKQVNKYHIVRPTIKVVKPTYDKGVIHPDGKITPLIFDEDY